MLTELLSPMHQGPSGLHYTETTIRVPTPPAGQAAIYYGYYGTTVSSML